MNKKYLSIIGIVVVLCAAICISLAMNNNSDASMVIPLENEFEGEYSYDGKEWHTYTEESDIPTTQGEIIFKGHLTEEASEGGLINIFCNHIGISVYVNGELIYINLLAEMNELDIELTPRVCSKCWIQFISPSITPEDEVEFHFTNIHKHGNENAYKEAISEIYISGDDTSIIADYFKKYVEPIKTLGQSALVLAVLLLGAAICAVILKSKVSGRLLIMSLITLFASGYILSDLMIISTVVELLDVRVYCRQICMMLALFFIGVGLCEYINGRVKRAAKALVGVTGIIDIIIIVMATTGKVFIFDMQFYWAALQLAVSLALIIMCICSMKKNDEYKDEYKIEQICYIILFIAVILDILGVGYNTYCPGLCSKITFAVVVIVLLISGLKHIIDDYHAAEKNRKLEEELENSRITVMLSQIKPHFLFNSLTSVMDLCDRDPRQAKDAIADFADYLRGNIDSLNTKKLIPFQRELEHIDNYLRLEKLRFQEDLEVEYDIQVKDFMLPSLSVQPLVENAVKHGLGKKIGSGTVMLSTKETDTDYVIQISDDGVGFTENDYKNDGSEHVGLENIRWRLEVMTNARLEIDSKKDEGTVATIFIPKRPV